MTINVTLVGGIGTLVSTARRMLSATEDIRVVNYCDHFGDEMLRDRNRQPRPTRTHPKVPPKKLGK